jgi:hypothetical protein
MSNIIDINFIFFTNLILKLEKERDSLITNWLFFQIIFLTFRKNVQNKDIFVSTIKLFPL